MDKVRDLADKIFSGDYANSGDMFKNIMQDKISEKLDEMTPVLFAEAAEKKKEEKKKREQEQTEGRKAWERNSITKANARDR